MEKEIFLEVSIENFKEIEKFDGFMPIYTYPKISEVHHRAWGYLIQNKVVFFFRIKHESEIIKDLICQVSHLRLLIYGLKASIETSAISLDGIGEQLIMLGKACDGILIRNK
jgi:hypothetical protein